MENDLISIIIPVYNVEKYINKCLESVINQTYRNLEIILVDDGSEDKSGKICEEISIKDNRIRVIHKENGGLSDARNIGLDNSNGEYIAFIDSDDFIERDMIEFLYYNINKYDADISICSNYIFDEEECIDNSTKEIKVYNRLEILKEVLLDEKIRSYAWNKMYKRDLFYNIRFPKGRVFEDILTIPKLFEKANKVVLNDVAKYYYRQREGSILHVQNKKIRLEYINAALEILEFLYKKEKELFLYCVYNYVHITIKTYNDIGLFNMKDMLNEDIVNTLYENTCKIFNNKEFEKFIIENSFIIKKLHFYFLLSNKDKYIEINKKLPLMYSGWKSK